MSVSTGERVVEDVLADIARQTTALVGDGCVVRVGSANGMRVAAVDHVEAKVRRDLEAELARSVDDPRDGWLAQALERRQSVRLPDLEAQALAAAGLPADYEAADVMVVPMPALEAVIVAVRDRWSEPFAGAHRRQVERIAAKAEAAVADGADQGRPERRNRVPLSGAASLAEATSAGLWVIDSEGLTVFVNGAVAEMVGVPATEMVDQPISDYLGRISQHRRGGFSGTEVIERPLVRADGEVRWVLATSRPLRRQDFGGECVLYTLLPFEDLHAREVALRLKLARTTSLLELAETAGSDTPVPDLVDQAVALIAAQLDVELASAGLFDLEKMEGRPLKLFGWPEDIDELTDPTHPATPLVEQSATVSALRSRAPVLVTDYEIQDVYPRDPLLERLEIRSAAVVPFADGTAAVGAHSPRPGAIDSGGLALMETVARLLEPSVRIAQAASAE